MLYGIWNALVLLSLLYAPGLLCGAAAARAAARRRGRLALALGVLAALLIAGSSLLLYSALAFMLNW